MEIIQDLIPPGRRNRPGLKLAPAYVTIHDTANQARGADALMHARYVKGDAAANKPVSWHFTADDRRVVQHLPLDEVGWHAGDGREGPGNRTSIAIEICENADGDRARAEANAAALVVDLLRQLGLGMDVVVQHNHWSGKDCPRVLRARPGGWERFLAAVRERLGAATPSPETPGGDGALPAPAGTPILGAPAASVELAREWARARDAHDRYLAVLPVYWQEAPRYGVRPEVAAAQAALETRFGKYGGVVSPDAHNWCGLKTRSGGANNDPSAHARFPDDLTGVRAHLQHLLRYAGGRVPAGEVVVDPRFELVKPGIAPTVEDLGGKWAPSRDYGVSIVKNYLAPLLATPAPAAPDLQPEVERLKGELATATAEISRLKELMGKIATLAAEGR